MKRARAPQQGATKAFDLEVNQKSKCHSLGDKKSWVLSTIMEKADRPSKEEMATLWSLQPEEKSVIVMYGKPVKTPRYCQSFSNDGEGYRFSGTVHEAKPIPPIVEIYMDYANRLCETILMNDYPGHSFNMALLNFYPDGNHYIGFHSDDESQLYKNERGETLVFSISFGQERRFMVQRKDVEAKEKVLEMKLANCSSILMLGHCQTNYKHSIPKVGGKAGKNMKGRLNLTFRIFKKKKSTSPNSSVTPK